MSDKYQTLIRTDDLVSILAESTTVLLDCRYALTDENKGRQDYLKSHIEGAYYLDLAHDLSSPVQNGITGRHPLPNPEVFAATMRAAGVNADSQVVVYDQSNAAYAARAWWLLKWLGHAQVAVLDGGFGAWTKGGHPVTNQWPAPKEGNFTPHIRHQMTIEKEIVASGDEMIIDSRDYIRYTGASEPIDPVAGHIAGAVCMPYATNTDSEGHWKSAEVLLQKFEDAGIAEDSNPVFYCGSGVTACHNILAYKIATGLDARLYPGSWSEWINYYPAVLGE